MKFIFFLLSLPLFFTGVGQVPLYEYLDIKKTLTVPEGINSERSVVVILVPEKQGDIPRVGNWEDPSIKLHKAFATMGVDVVMYINHYDLSVNENSKDAYAELLSKRDIKNIIFLTEKENSYQLLIAPFNNTSTFIDHESDLFYLERPLLSEVLLQTGREIKRADNEIENFLIPSKPTFVSGISIVEKSLLKNYPGILRRSTLSVERFAKMEIPAAASEDVLKKIERYNLVIEQKNVLLDTLMKSYPYKYELIDPLSDEDLLRQRRQFVLRSISGQAKTLREMLDYKVSPNETDFISVIPILPDQTRAKPIPKDALVHKFYIKQNISKNIHVGEWDADIEWVDALKNMIGNLIQEHKVDR